MVSLFSPSAGDACKNQRNGPASLEKPSLLQNASWRQRFHQSLTYLVLFSFFFQTLWPSVVFAEHLLHGEGMRPDGSARKYLSFGVHVDDTLIQERGYSLSQALSQAPRITVDYERDLDSLRAEVAQSLDIRTFYPNLEVQDKGLKWASFGLSFFLAYEGVLEVSVDETAPAGARQALQKLLRVFNPHGDIILGPGLALDHLQVHAKDIYKNGSSSIQHLEVWAQGGHILQTPSERTTQEGRFRIHPDAVLETSRLTVHQGRTEIEGALSLLEGGVWDANENEVTNTGSLLVERGTTLQNASVFDNDGLVKGKNLLVKQSSFINTKTIQLDSLVIEGGRFFNNGTMTLSQWYQGSRMFSNTTDSKITVEEKTVFEGAQVRNTGTLTLNGEVSGRLESFLNDSTLTMGTVSGLTVRDFTNTGPLTVTGPMRWRGQVFKTTNRTRFEKTASLTVPRLETNGDFTSLSSFILEGDWIHQGGLATVASLLFKGKTLRNQAALVIEELIKEPPQTQAILETVENDSGLPDQPAVLTLKKSDGITIPKGLNRGTLVLEAGSYALGSFDNQGGLIQVDSLSPFTENGAEWILTGTVLAKKLLSLQGAPLVSFINRGQVGVGQLTFEGNTFLNDAGATFVLGADTLSPLASRLQVQRFTNAGRFQSKVGLTLKGKEVQTTGPVEFLKPTTITARSFKTGSSLLTKAALTLEGSWVHETGTADISKLLFRGDRITNRATILLRDMAQSTYRGQKIPFLYNDRPLGKHALFRVLKGGADFGKVTNWGNLVVDTGYAHFTSLTNHGRVEVDWFSPEGIGEWAFTGTLHAKHMANTSFSKLLYKSKSKTTFDYAAFRTQALELEQDSTLTLKGHGEAKAGVLDNEGILALQETARLEVDALHNGNGVIESKEGDLRILLLNPLKSLQPYGWGPSLRVKVKGQDYDIHPGTLKVRGDLSFEMDAYLHIAESLRRFGDRWQCGGRIRFIGDIFRADNPVTYPGAVWMKVRDFQNAGHTLIFRSLDLHAETFQNGTSNEQMGLIETRKDQRNPEADTSLKITTTQDLDTRYGQILGHGKTTLTSTQGDVLIGEKGAVLKTFGGREISYPHESHPYHKYGLHNSWVASGDDLVVQGQNTHLRWAAVRTQGHLLLKAEDEVSSVGSRIFAKRGIQIQAKRFSHKMAHTHLVDTGLWGPSAEDVYRSRGFVSYPQSEPATLETLGDIRFDVPQVTCYASHILAGGSLVSEQGRTWQGNKADCPFIKIESHQSYKDSFIEYTEFGDGPLLFWPSEKSREAWLPQHVVSQVQAGKGAKLSAPTFQNSGYISGYTIDLEAGQALFSYLGKDAQKVIQDAIDQGFLSVKVVTEPEVTDQGLLRKRPDGTVGDLTNPEEAVPDRRYTEAPVLNQTALGFPAKTKAYLSISLEKANLQRMIAFGLGRVHEEGLSGDALFDRYFQEGQRQLLNGTLGKFGEQETPRAYIAWVLEKIRDAETDEERSLAVMHLFIPPQLRGNAPESGAARSQKNLTAIIEEEIDGVGAEFTAKDEDAKVSIQGQGKGTFKPAVRWVGDGANNRQEIAKRSTFQGGQEVSVDLGSLDTHALKAKAGDGGVHFTGQRHNTSHAVPLLSQQIIREEKKTTHIQEVNHAVDDIETTGRHTRTSVQGPLVLHAPHTKATQGIRFEGEQGVYILDVQNTRQVDTSERSGGGGFFGGGGKTTQTHSSSSVSQGAHFESDQPLTIIDHGGYGIILGKMKVACPKTLLISLGGIIEFLQGVNTSQYLFSESSKDIFWQSIRQRAEQHRTYSASEFEGPIEVYARQIILEEVYGQALSFKDQLDVKEGKVSIRSLEEFHRVIESKVEGPTAALSAVIAIAAVAAAYASGGTSLAGSSAVSALGVAEGTLAASIISAMGSAAFSAFCAQSALALVNHKLNIGRAAQDLANRDSLQAILKAMASAGLDAGIGSVGSRITMGLVNKEKPGDIFKSIVVTEISKALAKKIGQSNLGYVPHKAAHGILGLGAGFVLGGKEGALAGGLAGIASEVMADALKDTPEVQQQKAADKARAQGLPPTPENIAKIIREDLRRIVDIGRFSTAVLALLTRQDVGLSDRIAANALEHNFAQSELDKCLDAYADALAAQKFVEDALQGDGKEEQDTIDGTTAPSSPTGRTTHGLKAVQAFKEQFKKATLIQKEQWRLLGRTEESVFQNAYAEKQREVVVEAHRKQGRGESLSQAEQQALAMYKGPVSLLDAGYAALGVGALKAGQRAPGMGKPPAKNPVSSAGILGAEEAQVARAAANLNRNPLHSVAQQLQRPANQNVARLFDQQAKATGTHGQPFQAPRMALDDSSLSAPRKAPGLGQSEGSGVPRRGSGGASGSAPKTSLPAIPEKGAGAQGAKGREYPDLGGHTRQSAPQRQGGLGEGGVPQQAKGAAQVPVRATEQKTFRELDFSRYSPGTKGDAAHHLQVQHGQLRLDKEGQTVFYGDPVQVTKEAWSIAQQKNIRPINCGYEDVYVVPRPNSGYTGGPGTQRTNLDYILIRVETGTNKLITAHPSGAAPTFSKKYTPFSGTH